MIKIQNKIKVLNSLMYETDFVLKKYCPELPKK